MICCDQVCALHLIHSVNQLLQQQGTEMRNEQWPGRSSGRKCMLFDSMDGRIPPDICAVMQALLSLLVAFLLQPMVGTFEILSVCPNL